MMNVADIAFPNLGIYLENVPKTISIFGFSIAYYGIIIGLGIMFGFLLVLREAKITGQDPELYWDFITPAIICCIAGSRLYYVAFSWSEFKDNLWSIFNLRNGGIAIYGTVIAGFFVMLVFSKIKKISFFQLADTCCMGLILGQIIGRWGNFFNREAFGGYTNNILAMRLPVEAVRISDISPDLAGHIAEGINYIQVHPTFLYESLWNLALLCIILAYRKKKKFHGEIGLLYLCGYGIGRFFIEGLRTDQLLIPNTTIAISQILAAVMAIIAGGIILYVRQEQKKKLSV